MSSLNSTKCYKIIYYDKKSFEKICYGGKDLLQFNSFHWICDERRIREVWCASGGKESCQISLLNGIKFHSTTFSRDIKFGSISRRNKYKRLHQIVFAGERGRRADLMDSSSSLLRFSREFCHCHSASLREEFCQVQCAQSTTKERARTDFNGERHIFQYIFERICLSQFTAILKEKEVSYVLLYYISRSCAKLLQEFNMLQSVQLREFWR